MIDESKLDFHEATVYKFYKDKDSITLYALNGTYGEEFKDIILRLQGVKSIESDRLIDSYNIMFAEDGEVICLDIGDDKMTMVVNWNDFKNHNYETIGYEIYFERYALEILEPMDPIIQSEPCNIENSGIEKKRTYRVL